MTVTVMRKIMFLTLLLILGASFGLAQTEKAKPQPESLIDYEGRFEVNRVQLNNFIFDITADGDSLNVKASHSEERKFIFESKDSFSDSAFKNIKLIFSRNDKGEIKGFTLQNFQIDYYFDKDNTVISRLKAGEQTINAKKIELPLPSVAGNTTFKIKGFANAKLVALAGSFNNWNQSKNICVRESDGWICRIDLEPGTYFYKFVIDGVWLVDPNNKEVEEDVHGNRNSVIVVKVVTQ